MMFSTWQDMCFTIAGCFFLYSLIPQVIIAFKSEKLEEISIQFCVMSLLGFILSITASISLHLVFYSITSSLQFVLWGVLTYLKIKKSKVK